MQMDKTKLQHAATEGSRRVQEAFGKLSKTKVTANVTEIQSISDDTIIEKFKKHGEQAVVAFAQLISGMEGFALFVMSREQALLFIDPMNDQPVGSTGIMKDLDRSMIKETLNILSNAYLVSIAKEFQSEVMIGPPLMVTSTRMKSIASDLSNKPTAEHSVLLDTSLVLNEQHLDLSLYLVFDPSLLETLQQES